jgi:DNA-binding transcriptional regulator YiaG
MTVRREARAYTEGGLRDVWLEDVDVARCATCRDVVLMVPDPHALERAIVAALVRARGPLRGPEIRFLRRAMALSGKRLASLLGVTPSVLSRWENEKSPIGAQSDRLLRTLAGREDALEPAEVAALLAVDDPTPRAPEMVLRLVSGVWKRE